MVRETVSSPLGALWCQVDEAGALTALAFAPLPSPSPWPEAARSWLADYFSGRFRPPEFPLRPQGTAFRLRVWRELLTIAPGEVRTYGDLARTLQSGARAVGGAVAANPLPLIIPCHRVVGVANLGGFSAPGGVGVKQWLLTWEKPRPSPPIPQNH